MLINLLVLIAGLVLLALSSDRFVLGACAIATSLGVTPMVVGLTVVALGTSAPEMLVSGIAALEGTPSMALGNVVGSNIANISLVVGISALVRPLGMQSQTLRQEFPMLILVGALVWALLLDDALSRLDGVVLVLVTVLVLTIIVHTARTAGHRDPLKQGIESAAPVLMSGRKATLLLVLCLVLMVVASRMVVFAASGIAREFGVSDLVIGLTVLAVGTSLPEVAAAVAAALRGRPEMAIGAVLGSNMFNLLPVLAIAALITPFPVDPIALSRDLPIMSVLTVVLLIMCMGWRWPGQITRLEGAVLLGCFVSYQGLLYVMRS